MINNFGFSGSAEPDTAIIAGSSIVLYKQFNAEGWEIEGTGSYKSDESIEWAYSLLISGNLDPVTPPRFGEEVAKNMPNSVHLVSPGAHVVGNPCLRDIQKQFLETGTVEGLDTSCVETLNAKPFKIPKK